jgi:transcriptional regulator with XRE-family HTH domain
MTSLRLTFQQWAQRYGVSRLARDMGVSRMSVYGWLRGSVPVRRHIERLLELAGGQLEVADIILPPKEEKPNHVPRKKQRLSRTSSSGGARRRRA